MIRGATRVRSGSQGHLYGIGSQQKKYGDRRVSCLEAWGAVEARVVHPGPWEIDVKASRTPEAVVVVFLSVSLVVHAHLNIILGSVVVPHVLIDLCRDVSRRYQISRSGVLERGGDG